MMIWAKIGPETSFFCHFLEFGSLVFLQIAFNDSLQQCLTSSRGKIHKKNFEAQFWVKGAKIGSETRFFCHFLKFGSSVFHEIVYNDSLQQSITSSRRKTHEKIFGDQIWAKTSQNRVQN